MPKDRSIALLDAPSNLGLRPPEQGAVPGCYKAPGVFRDLGVLRRLGAHEAGVVTPPRYRPEWTPGTVRNEDALITYSRNLAGRLELLLGQYSTTVVLGGDCSIVVGIALALSRKGRYGLVAIDGLDYRHPGNSDTVGSAGGENLALVTGLGGALAKLDGSRPYLRPDDVVAVGFRPDDESADEAARNGIHLIDAPTVAQDPTGAAVQALTTADRDDLDGFWIHLDADVIDPELMPAVDTPEPGGLMYEQLTSLLGALLESPRAAGLDVTIYDPDKDPDLRYGKQLADVLVNACQPGVPH
jgi:arginase